MTIIIMIIIIIIIPLLLLLLFHQSENKELLKQALCCNSTIFKMNYEINSWFYDTKEANNKIMNHFESIA